MNEFYLRFIVTMLLAASCNQTIYTAEDEEEEEEVTVQPIAASPFIPAPAQVQPAVMPIAQMPPSVTMPAQLPTFGSMPDVQSVTNQSSASAQGFIPASVPQQVPVQKQEPKPFKVVEEKVEGIGIDTLNLDDPQGNWLLKRAWWERAEARYEKVRELLEEVEGTHVQFSTKRTELDRTVFDPFYLSVGLGQAELSIILNHVINQVAQLREKKGELSKQDRDFLEVVGKEQKTLDQLELDVKAVNAIDNSIDDALEKLDEQIALCRGYDKKAWQNLKDIARELSDKKAQELYYRMEAHSKSIQNVLMYIRTDYSEHFQKLVVAAQEHVKRISASITQLKEKGIDLEKQAKTLQDEADGIVPAEEVKIEPKAPVGWFEGAWNSITSTFNSGYNWLMSLFGVFSEQDEEEDVKASPARSAADKQEKPRDVQAEVAKPASTSTVPTLPIKSTPMPAMQGKPVPMTVKTTTSVQMPSMVPVQAKSISQSAAGSMATAPVLMSNMPETVKSAKPAATVVPGISASPATVPVKIEAPIAPIFMPAK